MENTSSDAITQNRQHQHFTRLIAGYTAFVAALLVAVITQGDKYPHSWIIVLHSDTSLSFRETAGGTRQGSAPPAQPYSDK